MEQRSFKEELESGLLALEAALVSEFLSPTAQRQYSQGKIAKAELQPYASAIRDISERYTGGRQSQKLSPIEAIAYALYYTPINFAKMLRLLSETTVPAEGPLSILDYGCGPGTAGLACLHYFGERCHIDAYDKSSAMTAAGKRLLARSENSTRVTFMESLPPEGKKYHLIIAANVLNELKPQAQKDLLTKFTKQLTEQGSIVLLEPALQQTTRALMGLRDWFLDTFADFVPRFPCTRRDHCPMLAQDPEGWCHGTLKWEAPQLVQQLDEVAGFNKHRIKYAGMVIQCKGNLSKGYRAILLPIRKRGSHAYILCGKSVYKIASQDSFHQSQEF